MRSLLAFLSVTEKENGVDVLKHDLDLYRTEARIEKLSKKSCPVGWSLRAGIVHFAKVDKIQVRHTGPSGFVDLDIDQVDMVVV